MMGEPETVTFRVTGPIQSGVLGEEEAAALRAKLADSGCDVFWGGHGCDRDRDHEGWHVCQDEDEPHSTVGPDGVDERGYQWTLYGNDAPGDTDG
jgi:hypothetical protein